MKNPYDKFAYFEKRRCCIMKIVTFDSYKTVDDQIIKDSCTIVIDLLRATSVMIAAISNGAEMIIPVEEVSEAMLFKNLQEDILLGGERDAVKIDGFDLDNSPLSYKKEIVFGKTIVITTTNGTRALKKCLLSKYVFLGSFINAKKTADHIIKNIVHDSNDTIAIVCAGTNQRFTLEDILCAGYFTELLKEGLPDIMLDDLSIASFELYKKFENNPHEVLKYSYHYSHLKRLGFDDDIEFCLKKDFVDCVCEYKNLCVKKV